MDLQNEIKQRTINVTVLAAVVVFYLLFETFRYENGYGDILIRENIETDEDVNTTWYSSKQNTWLAGDCPLSGLMGTLSPTGNESGWIEIYHSNSSLLSERSGTQHLQSELSCWHDAPEVCSSCCDGLHRGCGGERKPKYMTKHLRGKMDNTFPIAIKNGLIAGFGQEIPYSYALRKQGILLHNDKVTQSDCTVNISIPVMLIVSGRWTQATSAVNAAHWIAEVFGPLVQAAHTHKVDAFIPIVTVCYFCFFHCVV